MKYISLALLLLAANSYSSSDEPHPIIDSNYISKYSYNIKNMDLKELQNTRIILKNHLDSKNIKKMDTKKIMQEKLLIALLEYDDMRIQITRVIDEIIQEYNVNDAIKKILLDFKETFKIGHAMSFFLIWVALFIYSFEAISKEFNKAGTKDSTLSKNRK